MTTIYKIRNSIIWFFYRVFLRPVLFLFAPEKMHNLFISLGEFLGKYQIFKFKTRVWFGYKHKALEQEILGIKFLNPIGLAAGFDKDARLLGIIPCVGFGFEEAGSITARPFSGNEGKWLYRLSEAKILRVNYGLKNIGADAIFQKIVSQKFQMPVGISIAKTNIKETSEVQKGADDYFYTYKLFQNAGDYITINISCPNTCEESPIFAKSENLDLLLTKFFSIPKKKPVFIKLSPDLEEENLQNILEVCAKHPVDGFVCSNLTKQNIFKHEGKGGFSGMAVQELSDKLIATVYKYYNGKKIIIGCGGVFSATDAYRKIKLGASLVQLVTGMIYEGPGLISQINMGLVELLKKDGYKNIGEAVGKGLGDN